MKLDRSKQYTGWDLTWAIAGTSVWSGHDKHGLLRATVDEEIMQSWLDAGHITPVKQTKIVRVENVKVRLRGNLLEVFNWDNNRQLVALPAMSISKPVTLEFEVEVDE